MITWVQLWPLLVSPLFLLGVAGLAPTVTVGGHVWGGGPLREWAVNALVLPLVPDRLGWHVVTWFQGASVWEEWALYGLIVLNLNALALPVLYGFGVGTIRWCAWITRRDLAAKQALARSS